MDISKADKNFAVENTDGYDIEWLEIPSDKVSLFGVLWDGERFRRVPESALEKVSDNIKYLSTHTTGGRIVFKTDSPFIALKGIEDNVGFMSNMALFGVYGFSLSVNGVFRGVIMPGSLGESESSALCPDRIDTPMRSDGICFEGVKNTCADGLAVCKIGFPLFTGVKKLLLGVKKGCTVRNAQPYAALPPIVFYGSSITHGACASRAGLEYAGLLSEMLRLDFINVGFAGNCRGERAIAEYVSGINASLYVIEYDHNAPSVEFLENTHYELYSTLRKKAKNTPILFLSRPSEEYYPDSRARRKVVEQTCRKARENGDTKAFFLGGDKLFDGVNTSYCTADTCHPNDLGFFRMAKSIFAFIKDNNIL